MQCDDVQRLLSEHLDGDLPSQAGHEVERHVALCQECAQELQALRQVRDITRHLPSLQAPPISGLSLLADPRAAMDAGWSRPFNCRQVSPLMSASIDGELTADLDDRLCRHVETCAPCSQQLRVLERISDCLQALPLIAPGAGLKHRILNELGRRKVANRHSWRSRLREWLQPAGRLTGAVAGMTLLITTGSFILSGSGTTHREETPSLTASAPRTSAGKHTLTSPPVRSRMPAVPPARLDGLPVGSPSLVVSDRRLQLPPFHAVQRPAPVSPKLPGTRVAGNESRGVESNRKREEGLDQSRPAGTRETSEPGRMPEVPIAARMAEAAMNEEELFTIPAEMQESTMHSDDVETSVLLPPDPMSPPTPSVTASAAPSSSGKIQGVRAPLGEGYRTRRESRKFLGFEISLSRS